MKIYIFVLSLFLSNLLLADIKYITVTGYGTTKKSALDESLSEAIRQTKGVSINSQKEYIQAVTNVARSFNDENFQSTKINESFKKKIKEKTSGLIDGYEILSIQKEDNDFRATVKVGIYEYKTPGNKNKNRIKLAIHPFKGNYNINKKELSSISEALTSAVTQSRKFAVLDRQNDGNYQNEKAFIKDGNANKYQKEKLGKRLGADYILSGKINFLNITNTKSGSSIAGLGNSISKGYEISLTYKILSFSTGQIKWSDTIVLKGKVPSESDFDSINFASQMISKKLIKDMISNIYPLRVLQISDSNYAVINQGANTLTEGEVFDVFALGDLLRDTYTGESLGYEEIKTGQVIIERINPKVSYAKIIEGRVVKGSIVRISKKVNSSINNSNSTGAKVSSSGGVRL